MTASPLKAPFPYPGGKARVADEVWSRFGDVDNYVEPFAGSLAVLLRRPAGHLSAGSRVETVNDANHFLVNFWRAVAADPVGVAGFADAPVFEADLHARHKWLVRSREADAFRRRMADDPHHFDAKVAGWWVWGQCCWIGGAWCHDGFIDRACRPMMYNGGPGGWVVNAGGPTDWHQPPRSDRAGDAGPRQRPYLSNGHGPSSPGVNGRPQLADAFDIGRGVNGNERAGTCEARRAWLSDWMRRLSDRLRLVRTCYGHWSRVCDSDSTLARLGETGVFLDPPYPARRGDTGAKSRDANLYATDRGADLDALRDEVLIWCRKWGGGRLMRAAVCGYEGDGYEALEADGWSVFSWEAGGGYANQRRAGKGKSANARRERVWFSPHCTTPRPTLFDGTPGPPGGTS